MQLNWRVLGAHTDRNYTMGLGLARGGRGIVEQNHDFALKWADRTASAVVDATIGRIRALRIPKRFDKVLNATDYPKAYAEMLAGTAFTPESLNVSNVILGDRPYAFLLGWTVRRSTLLGANTSITTDLTIGTLGSRLGRNVQRFIHRAVRGPTPCDPTTGEGGPCDPKGWQHQIHDVPTLWGGVPTIRYGTSFEHRVARLSPVTDKKRCARTTEVLMGLGAEAGYYTDAYVSTRARAGYFSSPFYAWWQNPLSTGNLILKPVAMAEHGKRDVLADNCVVDLITSRPARLEAFVYAGARPRIWAYNALLQGYPGYEGYALSRSDVRTLQTDGELGITVLARAGSSRNWGINLTWEFLGTKSTEFRGPKARGHNYGGGFVSVTRSPVFPRF